jgi:hypothetical protein
MEVDKREFISLQEATQYCSYSADYLKLRARQGKLKAIKIGRAWVTKREWVEKYAKEIERYNKKRKTKKLVELVKGFSVGIGKEEIKKVPKQPASIWWSPPFQFLISLILASVLLTGGIFGKGGLYSLKDLVVNKTEVVFEDLPR